MNRTASDFLLATRSSSMNISRHSTLHGLLYNSQSTKIPHVTATFPIGLVFLCRRLGCSSCFATSRLALLSPNQPVLSTASCGATASAICRTCIDLRSSPAAVAADINIDTACLLFPSEARLALGLACSCNGGGYCEACICYPWALTDLWGCSVVAFCSCFSTRCAGLELCDSIISWIRPLLASWRKTDLTWDRHCQRVSTMAHANVSNSVLTIIANISNGLDVLKKLRRSHRKSNRRFKSTKRSDEDAVRLSRSLRHGPEEIGREYQAGSMRCDGERYAMGDGRSTATDAGLPGTVTKRTTAAAQTSLAEILLKLNTGLVSIITSFLHRDAKTDVDIDYKSLTDLSEHSRLQTISVLRQLFHRLLPTTIAPSLSQTRGSKATKRPKKDSSRHAHASPRQKHTKIRQPTLARVLIENSSLPSQIALVRPSENKTQRTISQPHSRSSSQSPHPRPSHALTSATSIPNFIPPPPYYPSQQLPPLPAPLSASTRPPRHHASSTSLLQQKPQPRPQPHLKHKPSSQTSPPPPSTNDLHRKTEKPRPETLYSVASARTGSTKLGEIPMHKWAEGPWDYAAAGEANRKALESGWPVGGDEGGRKKRRGWKRWFGKKADAR